MRHFRSIQLKFMFVLVGVLFIACISAMFAAFGYIHNSTSRKMEDRLTSVAQNISSLSKSGTPIEDIIAPLNDSMYSITFYPSSDSLPPMIDASAADRFEERKVYLPNSKNAPYPLAVMKINNSFIVMTPHADNNEIVNFRSNAITLLLFFGAFGGMLMLAAVRQITKPVVRLTRATQEVAKGNFDVTVDYHACDELGQLSHHFNLMTQELKNMEYLRKDFVSSVSHEFKTPIASIQGFAHLLKSKDLSKEEFEEYTDVIISESERLSKLSSNLLRLSRLENQAIPEMSATFSLDEQIRKTLLLLENDWSKKNLELDIDMQNISYMGNEEMLQQVWINLLSNAIKFSGDGGTLGVHLTTDEDCVRAEISDTGIGIPEDAQARIFEKFYQADRSHTGKGSGLGLSIVKQILDSCGGSITFKSRVGEGTTFIVLLPHRKAIASKN